MTLQQDQTCAECGTSFKGRIDKRFCSDECRTAFNNRQKAVDNKYISEINSILRKNRKILLQLNPEGKNRVSRDKMIAKGFNFSYFTSTYKTKDGAVYFYCYEQGYLPIEKDQCLLVVKKEFSTV